MNSYETPLIFFTVLSQMSIGMIAVSAVWLVAGPAPPTEKVRKEWLAAGVAVLVAMIASTFHLGHPEDMARALTHLATAWLSREALSVGVFLGLVALGVVLMRKKTRSGLVALTTIVGLVAVFSMGMTYSPPSFPALNNVLPLVFFLITAAVLGSSVGALFTPADKQPLLRSILTVSLIVGLVVYLIVPGIWLSGGAVMQETGRSWLAAPLYWAHIIVGLAIPLAVVWRTKRIPSWLWLLPLAGELMGRAVFFANTMHMAAHLGGLY